MPAKNLATFSFFIRPNDNPSNRPPTPAEVLSLSVKSSLSLPNISSALDAAFAVSNIANAAANGINALAANLAPVLITLPALKHYF